MQAGRETALVLVNHSPLFINSSNGLIVEQLSFYFQAYSEYNLQTKGP
jgi:hypothetical protein